LPHCLAPKISKGTPIKSIFNPLEKNPPIVMAKGTVDEVLEKIIFSLTSFFSRISSIKFFKAGTTK
jgi:hypothetical protein